MEICRQDQALEIRELDPFLAELLRQVPESAQPKDSPAAEERLFSAPAARVFEFRHFVRLERTDNEEAGVVLKFLKAHRVAPSGRRKSF